MLKRVVDLIYPRFCALCNDRVTNEAGHICWDCLSDVEYVGNPFCSVCGDPVEGMVENEYTCSACRRDKPGFDMARSAVRYRSGMAAAVRSLKYSQATHVARDLAKLLQACVQMWYEHIDFDAVTCVPLHRRKEKDRTFNQSELLARCLARALRKPLMARCLARSKNTDTQTGLSMLQRRKNVKDAFEADMPDWIEGRRLLLVDDVMTTGATVSECARVLKEAGAAGVHVVTVARG
jgi:ComF family protein